MDSYDVHFHPIQFQLYQLYDKESFWTFNIIKSFNTHAPLSSKSSDRKCLVNIRDILKRYY
jgi:hypothetical protein